MKISQDRLFASVHTYCWCVLAIKCLCDGWKAGILFFFSPTLTHPSMEIFMFEAHVEMGSKLNTRALEKGSGVKTPLLVCNIGVSAAWVS